VRAPASGLRAVDQTGIVATDEHSAEGGRLRIAHVSDLHVLSPRGVEWRRVVLNKRVTGYANLLLQRGRVYRREYLVAVLAAAAACADHLVVTGDITNLALVHEFEAARELLDEAARSLEVTVVPGNHDVYLPSPHRARRFTRHFAPYLDGDLPELAVDLPAGRFPFVKLRGPAAIIALSTAVPRPPFVSSGHLGAAQLEALARALEHPEIVRRTPVVLLHHPPLDSWLRLAQLRGGLVDAAAFRAALAPLERGLVLYGHVHERIRRRLRTAAGAVDAICATAAALDHPSRDRRAGFNLYEIDAGGKVASIGARVLDLASGALTVEEIPEAPEVA
jgi:3',5'-cyclic AMP phosphodiesterase CpdA